MAVAAARPTLPLHDGTVVGINAWTFSHRCDGPNLEFRVDPAPAQAFLDAELGCDRSGPPTCPWVVPSGAWTVTATRRTVEE
ncbi:hypothetical protein EKO23_11060 [Nocardioides guangzhouensis]|uniref:Uncharacterized protein n=1 Tax=Nocardioides guangzhouensis TaxID=2497878 RepID=A0A4Q4ZDW8_9ACTN|nr:hypothetical protein [Nocardioides guangzhouensis]RYP85845.1 hypothetical protein EKO23_11060 [Nocardioides guangzhouensis]